MSRCTEARRGRDVYVCSACSGSDKLESFDGRAAASYCSFFLLLLLHPCGRARGLSLMHNTLYSNVYDVLL